MNETDGDGQEREDGPADALAPIASALRTTYDAENHDSLGSDLTGLMLTLARVEPPAPKPPSATPPAPTPAPSWFQRMMERLRPPSAGAR